MQPSRIYPKLSIPAVSCRSEVLDSFMPFILDRDQVGMQQTGRMAVVENTGFGFSLIEI